MKFWKIYVDGVFLISEDLTDPVDGLDQVNKIDLKNKFCTWKKRKTDHYPIWAVNRIVTNIKSTVYHKSNLNVDLNLQNSKTTYQY